MSSASSSATMIETPREAEMGDLFALLKPRVMSLVVFTAAVGLVVAPGQVHPLIAIASILFVAVGAGASGALNMWWDSDIDATMRRTRRRPIPSGAVSRETALYIGLWLSGFSVVMLGLTANLQSAALLAFTIFFYAVVYTMFLKRRTPQNIVIGGAAGAFPPMIGWAVATAGVSIEAVLMFLLIFLWTPPHFWVLALFAKNDYTRAGIPMLPVVRGDAAARRMIFAYSASLIPVSLLIAFSGIGGPAFFFVSLIANFMFTARSLQLLRRGEAASKSDGWKAEKGFFNLSLGYLFFSFGALAIDAALRSGSDWISGWPAWI